MPAHLWKIICSDSVAQAAFANLKAHSCQLASWVKIIDVDLFSVKIFEFQKHYLPSSMSCFRNHYDHNDFFFLQPRMVSENISEIR